MSVVIVAFAAAQVVSLIGDPLDERWVRRFRDGAILGPLLVGWMMVPTLGLYLLVLWLRRRISHLRLWAVGMSPFIGLPISMIGGADFVKTFAFGAAISVAFGLVAELPPTQERPLRRAPWLPVLVGLLIAFALLTATAIFAPAPFGSQPEEAAPPSLRATPNLGRRRLLTRPLGLPVAQGTLKDLPCRRTRPITGASGHAGDLSRTLRGVEKRLTSAGRRRTLPGGQPLKRCVP